MVPAKPKVSRKMRQHALLLLELRGVRYGHQQEPPDWSNAPHRNDPKLVRSNRTSYDYTKPGAYVRKDERPGTTGVYAGANGIVDPITLVMGKKQKRSGRARRDDWGDVRVID